MVVLMSSIEHMPQIRPLADIVHYKYTNIYTYIYIQIYTYIDFEFQSISRSVQVKRSSKIMSAQNLPYLQKTANS